MSFFKNSVFLLIIFIIITFIGCGGGSGSNEGSDGGSDGGGNTPVSENKLSTQGSIAIIGLGSSIKVTNNRNVKISGVASSNIPIKEIKYSNSSTSEQGKVSGISEWSIDLILTEGDNSLTFNMILDNNESISISTIITYYESLDFTTPLQLDKSVAYIGDNPLQITAMVGTSNSNSPILELHRESKNGTTSDIMEVVLFDNGILPDEIEGDGIYTAVFNFSGHKIGYECFRVKVDDSIGSFYQSEKKCLWVGEHYTNDEIRKSINLSNQVAEIYQAKLTNSDTGAAEKAVKMLQSESIVAHAATTIDGGVWWITNSGLLNLHHNSLEGKKVYSKSRPNTTHNPPVENTKLTPSYYHKNNISRQTLDLNSKASNSLENRIKSSKAIIISPYIDNPIVDAENNFFGEDDYYGAWKVIEDKNNCSLYPATEKVNNKNMGVSINDFKNIEEYGYIHLSTHADNYYSGLLNLWQNSWGPNDFLQGNLSLITIDTGLYLPIDQNGDFILTGYEDDLQSKRLALSSDGGLHALPSFFNHYVKQLPNSLVTLSACRSMYNNSLAYVLLSKGAGATIGFDDYVISKYAQDATKTIISEMLTNDLQLSEAVKIAQDLYGVNDSLYHKEKGDDSVAYLLTLGSDNLQLSNGMLNNLKFENGNLAPWNKEGDGRIITQLGPDKPTDGKYMSIISTGLGFTTQSGKLTQQGCLGNDVNTISFNWNFYSEEFIEYCNTQFDDKFFVEICEVDSDLTNCSILLETSVNELCTNPASLSKSNISFDQGDVYTTNWQNATFDISAFSGKRINLSLYVTDVGDSIYDSAILVDSITFK
ncbi:hypothetical protein C9I98_01665 [Photobacterium sanctipauli]|uniref:Uncharacterized protein n=1 Tax=Photobacterium sanctipauli TaxID=1342794 RepID=A0A2T3P0E0_9GAMM|nr:choice-of-anchor L domain-containing protein [Photobacterium sanctipauli]PSW21996.1 hypothetical protein C9I98_01665 [Photobacterium sanctipauli]